MKTPNTGPELADVHTKYMRRAIELARYGDGRTSPNPMVGCVLVRDGAIIGEGVHLGAGLDHAEVAAIRDAGDAKGATAYVTLEPCCHQGRTGPCTEAIIKAGIQSVYYAVADPTSLAAGGAKHLESAGIEVIGGLCEYEAREMNRFWFFAEDNKRPFVVAKLAMSLDGRIATASGESQWITGRESRQSSHKLRKSVDAILVGADTIVHDNPRLTARDRDGGDLEDVYQPICVVIDSTGRTSPTSNVYREGTILATTDMISPRAKAKFEDTGATVVVLPRGGDARVDIVALLAALYGRGVKSMLVEGGSTVMGSFFDQSLVDEVWAYLALSLILGGKSKVAIGGEGPVKLDVAIRLDGVTTEHVGEELLVRGRIRR
ncbi:bifunctional diaminohydroxyphosphoribosylaminopyrimidine deaminase/5-amino-6-(5-phosphoribosylamino)uracil reductase RibD [Hyphococcus lacteus]|uniref:Riboflavin biosynthesis protein RibD n=1 Tax=Hyphococcus lacteus TaxID=3143536 RepID=A0ABV3Z0T4_9PROT